MTGVNRSKQSTAPERPPATHTIAKSMKPVITDAYYEDNLV
jgi:hypothetical protein